MNLEYCHALSITSDTISPFSERNVFFGVIGSQFKSRASWSKVICSILHISGASLSFLKLLMERWLCLESCWTDGWMDESISGLAGWAAFDAHQKSGTSASVCVCAGSIRYVMVLRGLIDRKKDREGERGMGCEMTDV